MHIEILSDRQKELLTYISLFRQSFFLVGGTAIALQIGHRRSIDYDLFRFSKLDKAKIKQKLLQIPYKKEVLFEDVDQLHLLVHDVKITFFQYPYEVKHPVKLNKIVSMPALISLAAMKAFALGRRAKWKDYVDLYFLMKNFFSIEDISKEADNIFSALFSEKLFRQQLAFHKDINYSEEVEFMEGYAVTPDEIKSFLTAASLKF
ncbi:MAG: nucleotidyl transferase AbiEii/AbiGii toxin family protein [Bacteroidales bacterium]|jgi:hypothetical protein|nr:nucleotidyl transferase AbiEii/AbiGii toxin family protein [Bacteroidales bacterium]